MKPTSTDLKVMRALFQIWQSDENYLSFSPLIRRTGLTRAEVRRSCRKLARNGLAEFGKGLWTADGEGVAGSGYCLTEAGAKALSSPQYEPVVKQEVDRAEVA